MMPTNMSKANDNPNSVWGHRVVYAVCEQIKP